MEIIYGKHKHSSLLDVKSEFNPPRADVKMEKYENISSAISSQQISGKKSESK